MIARLDPYRPPGSVSTVSVTLVTEALRDPTILDANLARVDARARPGWPTRSARSAGGRAVGDELPPRRLRDAGARRRGRRRRSCRRGLVPRTFGPAIPLADCLRLTVRDRDENDRLIAAAAQRRSPAARRHEPMTDAARRRSTIGPREGRRVDGRPRRTRETEITVTLGLDGTGHAAIDDRHRLLRPPPRLARPPRPVRPRDPRRRRPPGRRAPHGRGRRARARRGVRRGARRPGRDRPLRREHRADGRVARHAPSIDSAGGPYAVIDLPFRGERVGGLPLQLVEHALEAFARTAGATLHLTRHRPQRPPPRRGRVQGARPRARASPASSIRGATGVASTKGTLG